MFGNVTSSWANPQPGQQQQQQTGAFGTPSAFGATNTPNAFGSTSAFGQPQQQTPAANPMFGNLSTPAANTGTTSAFGGGGFGNTANAGTGAFGAKPAGSGFGAFGGGTSTGTTGAFGGGTTGAFGQPAAATSNTGGLFGQPAASTTGTTSAFGGGGVFGQNKPATSAFGATALGTAAPPAVTTGTANPPWAAHHEKDGNQTAQYQSIVCMPAYAGYSFEELRVQDYAQGRKTASAVGTGAFGSTPSAFGSTPAAQPSTSLFGATPAQPAASAFGATPAAPANNAFGAFGGTNTTQPAAGGGLFGGGGTFGSTPAQPATNSAFGGFGAQQQQQPQPSTGLFGGTNTFGANNNAAKPAGFGGFGTTPSTTGTTNNAFGGFGQTNTQAAAQPAAGAGLFGGTGTTTNNTFGSGGAFGNNAAKPLFGATNTTPAAPTNTFGGFGTTQQPAQQQQGQTGTGLFGQPAGGGLFGQNNQQQQPQANTGGGLFGATNTNTGGGLFGSGGGGLFGNNNNQQQQQQQPAANSLFGAKPAAPAAGGGLFGGFGQTNNTAPNTNTGGGLFGGTGTFGQNNNNNQQQSTFGSGLFGNKPAAPAMGTAMSTGQGGGLFGSTAGGSNNAFGGSTAPQQNPLTASINQPIGSNLPIFSMLPPGPRLVDLDQSQPKKKAPFFVDIPTRAPAPRGPTNFASTSSKLRGFGKSTAAVHGTGNPFAASTLLNGKPNALSLTESRAGPIGPDYLGRSGSPALGSGSRQSVKKVILDKKIEPSQLFVKSGSPVPGGKVVFSPALSIAARESEAAALAAKNNQHMDSPTPAPRAPPKKSGNKFTAAQSNKDAGERSGDPAHLEEGDYWVKPDLNTLKALGYDQLSAFKGLVVGRVGYGQIEFLEPVDLTGLSKLGALLGDVIHFEDQECSVYYDAEEADKPPPGSGLNVKARITLERCWPVDKATREPIKDLNDSRVQKQQKRLRNMKGTTFESFDMETGKWTFKVDHF